MTSVGHVSQMHLFPMDKYSRSDIYPRDTKKWNDFLHFHEEHPEVYEYFSRAVNEVKGKGFKNIGAKLLIERIRWEYHMDNAEGQHKINNNHFPYYARLFILNNPEFERFFELRKLKE